jgi:ABC-type nitrate/sulfonate/bicarbonate transport system ATPase subunit
VNQVRLSDATNERVAEKYKQDFKPKLEVCNLTKSYGTKNNQLTILKNINLQIRQGEFVCIVGASGCGKSTLMNTIAGLVAPTSGEIKVDDRVVLGPGSDRGMVFQSYTLYPWLTVAGNIGFGSKLRRLSSAQRQQKIAYFLEVVGLTKFSKSYPNQLSGGMKQRVAIARALANEPEVLLMDEPFGALDCQTKEQMQQFLRETWQQTGTTICTITHDVEEAVFLSQRIYVMSAHPGEIKTEIAIALPEDRDVDIKLTSKFTEIKRQIIYSLRDC